MATTVLEMDLPDASTDELRRGSSLLAGCILAMTVGVISLPGPAVGVFMTGLQRDFGWSRTGISLALSIGVGVIVLMSPVIGWLADRMREASILAVGMIGMAISFLAFSRMGGSSTGFILGYGLMMVVASGASTVPLARIISANFDRRRGMALGLAMVGTGLSGFLLPLLLVPLAATHGWRAGFVAMAVLILVCVPLVLFLLRNARHIKDLPVGANPVALPAGITFAEAARTWPFWVMALSFPLITLATSGVQIHFIALLADAGVSPTRAGAIASVSGITLIVVRLCTGWLIDRIFAPYVAAAMMAAAGVCMALFALFGPSAAVFGAVCYGLAVGAEIDIIAYLTARYFGMRAYGRIYGCLYATVLVGATFSPILYGLSFDRLHGYTPAMTGSAVLLIVAAGLLLLLPAFPPVHGDAEL